MRPGFDQLTHFRPFMAGKIVHDDDVALAQFRDEDLLDVGLESETIDGSVDDERCRKNGFAAGFDALRPTVAAKRLGTRVPPLAFGRGQRTERRSRRARAGRGTRRRSRRDTRAPSPGGGENWAVIALLIESCKLCGVDPQAYLSDVLTRIVDGHLARNIDELLPWACAEAPPLKDAA